MTRKLGFLSILLIASICEAAIVNPVSESHRSAAIDIFKLVDGSFKREDAKNPAFWSRMCLRNMAKLGKEATTTRRVLESLLRYFDDGKSWSSRNRIASPVLKDIQVVMDSFACGALCFYCLGLETRSMQTVKRYKKLIRDSFPTTPVIVKTEAVLSLNKCLLSSSDNKTVRLWRVGDDHCLNVFAHTDFVTCIHSSPGDENYFISGSVDGKVRIWAIHRCEVVDWRNVREIVTTVCYQPDGKGAIVGLFIGDCYFYNTSDNRLKMTEQTSLHSKKKTPLLLAFSFRLAIQASLWSQLLIL